MPSPREERRVVCCSGYVGAWSRGLLSLKIILVKALAFVIAASVWLPNLKRIYSVKASNYRRAEGIAPKARMLAERQLAIWRDPELRARELEAMQRINPEWEFIIFLQNRVM